MISQEHRASQKLHTELSFLGLGISKTMGTFCRVHLCGRLVALT